MPLRGPKIPALRAIAGYLLLGIAWAVAVPAFAGPDEPDHYRRVQAIHNGTLVGSHMAPSSPGVNPAQIRFMAQTVRAARIGPRRSPVGFDCFKTSSVISANCQDGVALNRTTEIQPDPMGSYEPLPYLAPAAIGGLGSTPVQALRFERLASFAVVFVLLAGALMCAAASAWLLAGVMLALPPAVLITGSSLGGSGLEIVGAIACATGLLSLGLDHRRGPALPVALAGGVALVGARALGPIWLLAVLASCLPLCFARLRKIDRRVLAGLGVALLVAVAAQRLWEGSYGPHTAIELIPKGSSLRAGLRELLDRLQESVGGVGTLEYLMPWPLVIAWSLAVVAVLGLAVRASRTTGERVLLGVLVVCVIAVAPLLFATALVFTGFGVQGRHVMPFAVLVPLVAACILASYETPTRPTRWIAWLIGAVQFVAFVLVAHRYAVGTGGPAWFIGKGWEPPLGWVPWLIVAAAGSALVVSELEPSMRARSGRSGSSDRSSSGTRRSPATPRS